MELSLLSKTLLDAMPRDIVPPCAGKYWLFDSTDPGDHVEAAKLCRTCPMLQECRGILDAARKASSTEAGHGPQGTWAGQPVGKATTQAHRQATEDAMFSIEEAREASREYKRGVMTDRNRIGARVHERRRMAAQRDRKRAQRAA